MDLPDLGRGCSARRPAFWRSSCFGASIGPVTIDRWVSEAAFSEFRQDFAEEYEALDRRLDGLAAKETRIDALAEIR